MRFRLLTCIAAATTLLAHNAAAQSTNFARSTSRPPSVATSVAPSTPNSSGSFVLEALGGSLGSLAGVGLIALTKSHGEDLGCSAIRVGIGGVAGAIGATVGTTLAAHSTNSRRSVIGSALGAVVGTGVGLGVHYAFNHDSNRNLGDAVTVPIFVVSQGTLSAIGSRMLGK
jgi:hypothetical protein